MTLSAGILAGGEGRRHGGADKGWLRLRGRPLVAHVVAALRPQAGELLVSANRNEARYAALGLTVVRDAGGAGPLAGLARLLAQARHDWLLCVPVDAPDLPSDLAARFLECAADTGAEVVALHDGVRAHPTFCLVRTALAADAQAALDRGDYSLMLWQQGRRFAWLRGEPPVNLNTPEALAALEQPSGIEAAA